MSVVRLTKLPLYSVIVASGYNHHAGVAGSDGDVEGKSTAENLKYRAHFLRESYSLPSAVRFFPEFKPKVFYPSSGSIVKGS